MTSKILISATIAAVALFFQNCGKVGFSSLNSGPTLSTESTPTTPPTSSTTTTTETTTQTTPTSTPPTTTTTCSHNYNSNTDIVECDLGANAKVILNGSLVTGSNASSTRVCMSQNACLNLVNAYAESHNCTLATGAATTPNNQANCTMVFPGSQGTCRNAQILSDDAVDSLLAKMATE